jgi:hypothetical protein
MSTEASTALQLQGPVFQAAKKAKQDAMEAAEQLVYDVEWQASHAWRAGAAPSLTAGKP